MSIDLTLGDFLKSQERIRNSHTWNMVCTITSSRFGQYCCLHFLLKRKTMP